MGNVRRTKIPSRLIVMLRDVLKLNHDRRVAEQKALQDAEAERVAAAEAVLKGSDETNTADGAIPQPSNSLSRAPPGAVTQERVASKQPPHTGIADAVGGADHEAAAA